jgi:ribosomal protein L36
LTPFQKAYFHFLNAYKCNATVSQCSLYKVQKPYANPDPASTLFLRQFFLQPLGMENLSFARREGVAFIVGSSTMVWLWRCLCIARRKGVAFIICSSTMVWPWRVCITRRESVAFIVGSSTMVWSWRVCIARREGVAFIIGSSTMVWRVVGYS